MQKAKNPIETNSYFGGSMNQFFRHRKGCAFLHVVGLDLIFTYVTKTGLILYLFSTPKTFRYKTLLLLYLISDFFVVGLTFLVFDNVQYDKRFLCNRAMCKRFDIIKVLLVLKFCISEPCLHQNI